MITECLFVYLIVIGGRWCGKFFTRYACTLSTPKPIFLPTPLAYHVQVDIPEEYLYFAKSFLQWQAVQSAKSFSLPLRGHCWDQDGNNYH
jgi:hypothetical protein